MNLHPHGCWSGLLTTEPRRELFLGPFYFFLFLFFCLFAFQSLALFCRTEIIGSLSETDTTDAGLCHLHATLRLGPRRKPHLGHKRSFCIYLLQERFPPSARIHFIRLKHRTRLPPKRLSKSGAGLEVEAHVNQTRSCAARAGSSRLP